MAETSDPSDNGVLRRLAGWMASTLGFAPASEKTLPTKYTLRAEAAHYALSGQDIETSLAPPAANSNMPAALDDNPVPHPRLRDAFRDWLAVKDRMWSVAIATRAALRVLPLVEAEPANGSREILIITVFRCSAISRFTARYRNREAITAYAAAAVADVIAYASEPPAAYASVRAAYAAARTAALAADIAHASTGARAAAAATASYSYAMDAASSYEADTTHDANRQYKTGLPKVDAVKNSEYLLALLNFESNCLESGISPSRLMNFPLWPLSENQTDQTPNPSPLQPLLDLPGPSNEPSWAKETWATLKRDLLRDGAHWQVWIDWYDDVLAGKSRGDAWEEAFVDLDPDDPLPWDAGPQAVNEKIAARLKRLTPVEPVDATFSPVAFGWNLQHIITVTGGIADRPKLPFPTSEGDHAQRLNACHTLADDLAANLAAGRYQARGEYRENVERYRNRLPAAPGTGNMLLADAAARALRGLFAAEADILPAPLAVDIKVLLEQHMGLRPFYPEIERFYADVKSGRMEQPLPLDAVEGFIDGVRAHSPQLFDTAVAGAVEEAAPSPPPAPPAEASPLEPGTPVPPADPLGDLDPKKSRDYSLAGAINALWKAFLKGDPVVKSGKAWSDAYDALSPYAREILDWLRNFIDGSGGGPTLPPTVGT